MKRRGVRCASALLAVAGVQFSPPAPADFPQAFQAFEAGRYAEARAEFLQLAQLGHAASQFDLGAMALHGQGGPEDLGAAVGWFTAAADNGDTQLPPEKLAAVRATLNDEQLKTADDIVNRYGHAGLLKTVLPASSDARCPDIAQARLLHAGSTSRDYPREVRERRDAFVVVQLSIGADGVARDPEVLMAAPTRDFPSSAVHIAMSGSYQPATRDGKAIESKLSVKVQFKVSGGSLWDAPKLKSVRQLASDGVPSAEYVIGLAAALDSSLGISVPQAQVLLLSAAQGGDASAQYWVANLMSRGCQQNNKMLPWLQAAASGGSGAAQLALAMRLLSGTPSAEQLTQARLLLEKASGSDDFYVLTHVAALLAASPFEAIRDAGKARAVADKLDKDPVPSDPQLNEAIAAACAANGDFRKAVDGQQTALSEASRLHWSNLGPMEARLATYRASKPWFGDLFADPSAAAAEPAAQ
jgi:uncharacterized protein